MHVLKNKTAVKHNREFSTFNPTAIQNPHAGRQCAKKHAPKQESPTIFVEG